MNENNVIGATNFFRTLSKKAKTLTRGICGYVIILIGIIYQLTSLGIVND